MSCVSNTSANSRTYLRMRGRLTRGFAESSPSTSAQSWGRLATAFKIMRSAGFGSGKLIFSARVRFERRRTASSKGNVPRLRSTSMPVGGWRTKRTLDVAAKSSGSPTRGRKPNLAPLTSREGHASSSTSNSASTSSVKRGYPSIDTATPPITTPLMSFASNHATRSRRHSCGNSKGRFSVTKLSPKQIPPLPYELFVVVPLSRFRPAHRVAQFIELAVRLEPLLRGHSPPFLGLEVIEKAPASLPLASLLFRHHCFSCCCHCSMVVEWLTDARSITRTLTTVTHKRRRCDWSIISGMQ
jgi:hypothetical protein